MGYQKLCFMDARASFFLYDAELLFYKNVDSWRLEQTDLLGRMADDLYRITTRIPTKFLLNTTYPRLPSFWGLRRTWNYCRFCHSLAHLAGRKCPKLFHQLTRFWLLKLLSQKYRTRGAGESFI
ncbi:hypothetical protein RhiirA5_375233 [Rhizophagus irregularis]|uniref:Uncharacterized protein n=1 Tax=Rhizophagus irregularis TaxID=588596 RepID=A0A2N0PS85_9GLOM|nr:hypothetical protein RhiirA5_375233 [Rhizophagus irregularis]